MKSQTFFCAGENESPRMGRRALLSMALAVAAPASRAQGDYPSKPIRFIQPLPPGATSDVIMRYLMDRLSDEVKQPVYVENVVGASGLIGTQRLAASPADGYTLGMTSNGFQVAASSLFKKPGFDPVNSFEHICLVWFIPWILVTSTRLPVDNFVDFLRYVKANPKKLTAGWHTASSRFSLSQLRRAAGLDVLDVPYKAATQVVMDIRGGQIDFAFLPPDVAFGQAAASTLKVIAVSSPSRGTSAPNLPTLSEQLPGLVMVSWVGIAAPAGTPKAITSRIEAAYARIMERPEVKEKIRQFGAEAAFIPAARIPARILEEIPQFAAFAREAKIDPE